MHKQTYSLALLTECRNELLFFTPQLFLCVASFLSSMFTSPDLCSYVSARGYKGVGPYSQHNWLSWQQLNGAGTPTDIILKHIFQLCYKHYWGQTTCSCVNKSWDITSQSDTMPSAFLIAGYLSALSSLLFINSHITAMSLTSHNKTTLSFHQTLVCDCIIQKVQRRDERVTDAFQTQTC